MTNKENLTRREFFKASAVWGMALAIKPPEYSTPEISGKSEGGYEVVSINETGGMLSLEDTPVYLIPLRTDYFIDEENHEVEEWEIGNLKLGFNRSFILRDPNGGGIEVATLPHLTGERFLPIVVMGRGTFDGLYDTYRSRETYARTADTREVSGEYGVIGDYYPNKIYNLLEATKQLLTFQKGNGSLRQEESYSFLDMINLVHDRDYRFGLAYPNIQVRGQGVCGIATVLAHALSQTEGVFEVQQPHTHWTRYFVGPLDADIELANDTAVSIDGGIRHDFIFSNYEGYISADVSLAVTGSPRADGLTGNNASVFIQLSLSSVRPNLEGQEERISAIQQAYTTFNRNGTISPLLTEGRLINKHLWQVTGDIEGITREVYHEESLVGFENDIRSEPYLRDITSLKEIVHQYIELYPYETFIPTRTLRLGEFIRGSEWFNLLSEEKKNSLESALNHLNGSTYKYGEPEREAIQCIGWVVLLSALGYESSPISISSHSAEIARDLIPTEMRVVNCPRERNIGQYYYFSLESLDEFETGDLFVPYEIPFEATVGHVGAVIDKKVIDGQTVLLVSDANRKRDGRVRVFRVDDANKYAIFGEPPRNWVILRRRNV